MSKLQDLPVLIDRPGNYVTRDGSRVVIFTVTERPEGYSMMTFDARGSYTRVNNTAKPECWHISGRLHAFREHPKDVVAKA
ncbi:hypothetical protein BIZ95_gp34 [Pseudomonas phage vB_PaeP_MAG4]|nr:hypothetical protein BIZ95_gp34 [Pseudomonas phage vB_PaeP_MAG4]YP_010659179.1 cell division protein [Pseudomonas phage vB_Pae575P-3]AIZ94966.1 hypothetical protein [Pseudomonas phage phi176]ANT44402.1 cell division protein [Pseudomonas phage vB_Pae1396P-5]AKH49477.1 hypothetical protein vB_PaeP_fi6_034 [Pseudomonas phage vB_PaeP_MAG4]ANT44311.1 cell division protein [Pseudomonas phage vB_Pae575P-3]